MASTFPIGHGSVSSRQRRCRDYNNLALWTFQGWIAMFFIAAGYAKLTEPMDSLIFLMRWPEQVSESVVRGLGILEILLACGVPAPLMSWRLGRVPLVISSVVLIALQTTMLARHAIGLDVSLAVTNLALLAITIPVFLGRRASR